MKLSKEKKIELQRLAIKIRMAVVEELKTPGTGHIGGALSMADALTVLYGAVMNIDPKNPKMEERDKFVCSKGHAGPGLYATLAVMGYFPYDELKTLNQPKTNLPSHCDKNKTPGVDMTTGSLGQGTSLAVGMALADKLKGLKSKTFVMVGDGESDEGQVWEAAMFTAAKKVTNLVWLIDDNKKQLDGYTNNVLNIFDLRKKFETFGFEAIRINGNDLDEIYEALTREIGDKPLAIVLDTVKGKGIKDVEETVNNHTMVVNAENSAKWLGELQSELEALS